MPIVEDRVARAWPLFRRALATPTGSTGEIQRWRPDDGLRAAAAAVFSLLDGYPNLSVCLARGEARPAYRRAYEAQPKAFENAPARGA